MNSIYPFNTVSSSMPETINALRAELEDKIKETIFETFGSNIPQEELESLMDSFSPIIQRQVNKYVRELNNLNQSVNYTTNINNYQCYPYYNQFNEYSPMISNNFVQNSQYDDIDSYVNSAIYGSNFQNRNNFRNKGTSMDPKPIKLRNANLRSKKQNNQKASKSFGDITEPTKQTKTSPIQKIEPTPKPIDQIQKTETIQKQNEPIPQKPTTISHTAFFSNIPWNYPIEKFIEFVESFGEISYIYSLVPTKGIAFVTYCDIRNAQKAVEKGGETYFMNRPLRTNYANKSYFPHHDPTNTCATILVKSLASPSKMTIHEVISKMKDFGEIMSGSTVEGQPGTFVVKYYNIKDAHKAMENKLPQIGSEMASLEYKLEQQPPNMWGFSSI